MTTKTGVNMMSKKIQGIICLLISFAIIIYGCSLCIEFLMPFFICLGIVAVMVGVVLLILYGIGLFL